IAHEERSMMDRRSDRRAALKLFAAAPLGLAAGAILAQDAAAQVARGSTAVRAGIGPVEPGAGGWKTWLLVSGNDLRVSPPPDESATVTEVEEVRSLAAGRQAMRDRIAFWDAGAAPYRWNEITLEHTNVKNNYGNNLAG